MGFSMNYLEDNHFLLTKVSGKIDDLNLIQYIIEHSEKFEGISDIRELRDIRNIGDVENLSKDNTAACAEFSNYMPESLLALLVPDSAHIYTMASVVQSFNVNRRKDVKIFKDTKEALAWLAYDDKEIKVLKGFINNIKSVRKTSS